MKQAQSLTWDRKPDFLIEHIRERISQLKVPLQQARAQSNSMP
jgi:hypothetical protein